MKIGDIDDGFENWWNSTGGGSPLQKSYAHGSWQAGAKTYRYWIYDLLGRFAECPYCAAPLVSGDSTNPDEHFPRCPMYTVLGEIK